MELALSFHVTLSFFPKTSVTQRQSGFPILEMNQELTRESYKLWPFASFSFSQMGEKLRACFDKISEIGSQLRARVVFQWVFFHAFDFILVKT